MLPIVLVFFAFFFYFFGNYKILEKVLIGLSVVKKLSFLMTASN